MLNLALAIDLTLYTKSIIGIILDATLIPCGRVKFYVASVYRRAIENYVKTVEKIILKKLNKMK